MENVRIAILSANDVFQASLDNNAPNSMHYYDDELHTYLQGSQYTFECKVYADHDDAEFLVEGNHLSFKYKDHDYYCTIMHVEKDDEVISLEAYGLTLELTNETVGPYKGNSLTFEQYINAYGFEKTFVIGINEVSNKKISNEWTGTDTILARLFSLANVFDAELEFITELDDHYSLKHIKMNIYQKHDDTHQGIGEAKNEVIRDGNGIEKVTKESDISELYTVIRPTGKDGLNLKSLGKKIEYDSLGNEEFIHEAGSTDIRAVQARDRFPSISMGAKNDRWIVSHWDTDISGVNNLYGRALAELKKNCKPKVSYDIKGYIDGNIGDTYIIEDTDFRPALYLKARIVEQRICFTDSSQNKTVFDNFTEMQSEIDQDLLTQMQDMIKDNKQYQMVISSSHGLVLPPSVAKTVLTVFIKDGANDITKNMTVNWYNGDILIFTGTSISVERIQLQPNLIYRCEAVDTKGKVRATSEITITKVDDGDSLTIKSTIMKYQISDSGQKIPTEWLTELPEIPPGKYLWVQTTVTYSNNQTSITYSVSRNGTDGQDGQDGADAILLYIDSSNGNMFKNSNISTTLTVSIIVGDKVIDNYTKLIAQFGSGAHLIWEKKEYGSSKFVEIPSDDPRLSDHGFIFTLHAQDVETKIVLNCKLDY